jgi:hypothetical protein
MASRMVLVAAVLAVLALAAAGYGALLYMTAVPGEPHRGALPPLTAEETALAGVAQAPHSGDRGARAQRRALRRAGKGGTLP